MQTLKMVKTGRVSEPAQRYLIANDVYRNFHSMGKLDREHFVVIHLDGQSRMIAKETISIGSLNAAIIHPREVFKAAVHHGSAAIICIHNHPSGATDASDEDISITKRLIECGELLGIKVLEHLIIGDGYSSVIEQLQRKGKKPH